MARFIPAGAVVAPIPCVVSSASVIPALQELLGPAQHAGMELVREGGIVRVLGDLRVHSLPASRLLMRNRGRGDELAMIVRASDDFLGASDPIAIARSWLASVRVAVSMEEETGARLLDGPRRCASLIAAAAVGAGLEDVRAGCFSSSPYQNGDRFVLSAYCRRLRLPETLRSYLARRVSAFRYLLPDRGSKYVARRIYALVTPADLGPVELLRLVGQLPPELIEVLRRTKAQDHAS